MTTKFNLPTIIIHRPAQIAAFNLAVAYNAYNEAVATRDRNGVRVWGRMLIAAMEKTGVEIIALDTVRNMIDNYRKARAA